MMTFLKSDQVDTSLLPTDDPALAAIILSPAAVTSTEETVDSLSQFILDTLSEDTALVEILTHLCDTELPRSTEMQEKLQPFSLDARGFLLHDGLIYVPAEERLKVEILNLCHDAKTAGHLGIEKTLELVLRNYYWPGIRAFVKQYCRTCDTCARNKSSRHAPYGHLHPLPIPEGVWDSVSMDYIVKLPESEGYNAIYVCVDQLTKMAHFIPTTTRVTAE